MPAKDNDYEKMSVKELRKLQQQVAEALSKAQVKRKNELLAKIQAMVEEEGFTMEELFGNNNKESTKKTVGVPKFRDPNDPTRTWTGKGKRPAWLNELLAKGHKKEEFLIK